MEASVNLFEAIILHRIDRFSAEDFYTKKVIIENEKNKDLYKKFKSTFSDAELIEVIEKD